MTEQSELLPDWLACGIARLALADPDPAADSYFCFCQLLLLPRCGVGGQGETGLDIRARSGVTQRRLSIHTCPHIRSACCLVY